MKQNKEMVYIPVSVEDELPDNGTWVICDGGSRQLLYSHTYGLITVS